MPAALVASYIDLPDMLANANMQLETQTLVGLNTTIATATVGQSSLTVASTSTQPATTVVPFPAYILDGAQCEVVTVTAQSGTGGTTFTLASPLLATHAAGVSISTAGVLGCLADAILVASRGVDLICMQGPDASGDLTLFATSRTETLYAPSLRAVIDRDFTLIVRPYHFPVRSLTSISIQQSASTPFSVNLATIPNPLPYGMQRIDIPFLQPIGSTLPSQYITRPFNRAVGAYVTLTYVAGPIPAADLASVPYDIREATRMLVADQIGIRGNNTGAASVKIGDVSVTTELRGGGAEGNTRLRAQAMERLKQYRTPAGM
jgi:hypothetical protein